jgi:hypothetical protein
LQIDDFETIRHKQLVQMNRELIQAKKLLQDISKPRRRCLEELSLHKEFVDWLREALGGTSLCWAHPGLERVAGCSPQGVPSPDHIRARGRPMLLLPSLGGWTGTPTPQTLS